MAEVLVLEFEGFGRDVYDAVNRELGMDEDWSANAPEGLISHLAGASGSGWVVVEAWESKAQQEAFMESRLGAALQAGGVPGPPTRVEWLSDADAH